MDFTGFSREAITFLQELSRNNNRQWFEENKSSYKRYLEPAGVAFSESMQKLLTEMTGEPFNGKIFRIYRDVRFSKDKTPYNTHLRILFYPAEVTGCSESPAFYFSLETDRVITGAGLYEFSKPLLERFREAVDNNAQGIELENLLENYLGTEGYYREEPRLKRVPQGYDKDHPRAELLMAKGLAVWHEAPIGDTTSTPAFLPVIVEGFQKLKPVYDWIKQL